MALDREPVFVTQKEKYWMPAATELCVSCGVVVWDVAAHIKHHQELFDALAAERRRPPK